MASVGQATGTSDAVGVLTTTYTDTLTERVYSYDLTVTIRAFPRTLTETVNITQALASQLGIVLAERLQITSAAASKLVGVLSLAEQLQLVDALTRASPAALSENIALSEALTALRAVALVESLSLTDALAGAIRAAQTITEQLQVAAVLARFLDGSLAENLAVTATPSLVTKLANLLTDTVAATDAITPVLLIRTSAAEHVNLADVNALQAIYAGQLAEDIVFDISYLSPGGGLVTWAMNARSAGVTQYDNFNFNSYAPFGLRYIATSHDGLYELDGTTDDGTLIMAEIAGGFLQFGGGHLSRLKGAYIAARGDGQFLLKIEEGGGRTFVYQVDTRSMRSTKAHMGKGQKARYFAYTLTSTTGADFDLDSIEFVPIVVPRRV